MRQPRFLFIFALPYTGSTALAQVLNSSPKSMLLNLRAEGQWMVPTLSAQDRWNPNKQVDWKVVKRIWLERYHLMDVHEGPFDVIIEKSPSHIVRATQLLATFPGAACFAFNRNPYANCASILYRLHSPAPLIDPEGRHDALAEIAKDWVTRSDSLRKLITDIKLLYFSYEAFCMHPEQCVTQVLDICPELESINCSRPIAVKDYPAQGISDQNPRQISLLTRADKDAISAILNRRVDLMDYFGYSVL